MSVEKSSTDEQLTQVLEKWCQKLRITPFWSVRLQIMDDPEYRKTGDIKIDCDNHSAIVIFNRCGANGSNPEAVIAHELFHLKMYPLDQVTESLILASFPKDSPAQRFAYTQFFSALEQTVDELTKCFLLDCGENREFSFGRCERQSSFDELYQGLKKLE